MIRTAWKTWFAHLSGTRQQITLVVLLMWAMTVWYGIHLMKTGTEAVEMLKAITPVFIATAAAWFGGHWLQQNTNDGEKKP